MQTRTRHNLSIDTVETLARAKNGATWREYAEALGYSKSYAATLNKAARGQPGAMTSTAENILRARLGLHPIHAVEVAACPDCGAAHTGRCYGKPVASVEVLSDGDTIIRKRPAQTRTRKRAHRPYITDDAKYADYLQWSAAWDAEHSA